MTIPLSTLRISHAHSLMVGMIGVGLSVQVIVHLYHRATSVSTAFCQPENIGEDKYRFVPRTLYTTEVLNILMNVN